MTEHADPVAHLLSNLILPNLKAVQVSQNEQIAANDRLEHAIDELRAHINSEFARLNAQLTACHAELAATQALLRSAKSGSVHSAAAGIIH